MSQLTTLLPGVGINTNVLGLTQLDNIILVGDSDDVNVLQGLRIDVDNDTKINIQSQIILTAFAKWMNNVVGPAAAIGLVFRIASGRIKGNNIAITLTNAGATTPAVYAFSDAESGLPLEATTATINALSYNDYDSFSAVIVANPAAIASIEVEFTNGCKSTMIAVEAAALFVSQGNAAEALGYLGGALVFDNRGGTFRKVRIYSNATPITLCLFRFPQSAFDALKRLG